MGDESFPDSEVNPVWQLNVAHPDLSAQMSLHRLSDAGAEASGDAAPMQIRATLTALNPVWQQLFAALGPVAIQLLPFVLLALLAGGAPLPAPPAPTPAP